MKIIYLFTHDLIKHSGVTKKVISQTNILKKLGHQVKICNISLQKSQISLSPFKDNEVYYRNNIFNGPKRLIQDINKYNPDIIYFRFEPYKPYLGKILKNYKVIVELNTNDYKEMKLHSKKNFDRKIRFHYYNMTKSLIYKNIVGFVAVTDEIANLPHILKWKKPSISIPNSIDINNYKTQKISKSNNISNILFMGNLDHEWNGIDKIIDLAKKTVGKLYFHIIGLNNKYRTDFENIKFYGYLQKKEYLEIVKKCDIGLGTVALHRKQMFEACPLKVREYLAYGLPIIIGYSDATFVNSKLPEWVLELPNENNNISNNVGLILEFCKKMKNRIIHHDEIKNYIDSNILEINKLVFFKKIIDG
jgi:hypothetical protein